MTNSLFVGAAEFGVCPGTHSTDGPILDVQKEMQVGSSLNLLVTLTVRHRYRYSLTVPVGLNK